jgi:putative endonuclease
MEGYWVYAIRSKVDGRIYVGLSRNPDKRVVEHNNGETFSTKPYRPWVLIYKRYIGTRENARKEEKRLKSGYGKEWLKQLTI